MSEKLLVVSTNHLGAMFESLVEIDPRFDSPASQGAAFVAAFNNTYVALGAPPRRLELAKHVSVDTEAYEIGRRVAERRDNRIAWEQEYARNTAQAPTPEDIIRLANKSPIVARHLDEWRAGYTTWDHALRRMVVSLAEVGAQYEKRVYEMLVNQAPAFHSTKVSEAEKELLREAEARRVEAEPKGGE